MHRALNKAGLDKDDIGRIILVGGATKTPLIYEKLSSAIKSPYRAENVDESVAHGAAIRADELARPVTDLMGKPVEGEPGARPVELVRITPFNLGVRATANGNSDAFSVIIPHQQQIPAEINRTYTTERDNQTSVPVGVFQGFGESCSDNDVHFVGGFLLNGIPKAKARQPDITVTFKITADDLLEVYAECGKVSAKPVTLNVNETKDMSEIYGTSLPTAVVLCIDVSGSMSGKPLKMAKKASLAYIAQKSSDNTQIGCVGFGSSAELKHKLTANFDKAAKGVDQLKISGSTNMTAGLTESLKALKKAPSRYRKQVILLTDGRPNSRSGVRKMIKKVASDQVAVHTVGAGKKYDRTLLEEISTKTGGVFVAANDIDKLVDAFLSLAEK